MATPNQRPGATYLSNGQMLENLPMSARINRAVDNVYNMFGLYLVSLFSLDPYTSAQNSQFNTMARGPNAYQNRARWGGTNGGATRPSGGSGGGSGGSRPGGSGGGAGGGGSGRRMGTVDDVRGPECGSCG